MGYNKNINKAKIVATVGPASDSKEMLKELIYAGVNVFRLNFSHGDHANKSQIIERIRDLNNELGTYCSILQDLQGPKIRVGEIEGGEVLITPGQEIVITTEQMVGNSKKVSTVYENLSTDVSVGDMILIDDGNLELTVKSINGDDVTCVVKYGGMLQRTLKI